jgi:hypothetical protein
MREKVQPRMTQLEQSQMPEGIQQLMNDLQENPDQAFLQMAYELYGEEAIPFFETAMQYIYGDQGAPTGEPQEPQVDDEGWEIELDPEDRSALDFVREQREDAAYSDAIGQLAEAYPDSFPEGADVDSVKALISPFVVAADGDLASGFELYNEWLDSIESGAVTPEEAADAAEQGLEPSQITPQVLGNGGLAPGAPTLKQGQGLGDAVQEMLDDLRASKGPPSLG